MRISPTIEVTPALCSQLIHRYHLVQAIERFETAAADKEASWRRLRSHHHTATPEAADGDAATGAEHVYAGRRMGSGQTVLDAVQRIPTRVQDHASAGERFATVTRVGLFIYEYT